MFKSDIEIARDANIKKIKEVAKKINIDEEAIELYGNFKAKLDPNKISSNKNAKLILVTAISPTKAGEGKSTTTIGLGDALNKIGKSAMIALREPSLGPVFGLKGGATGGGYAQVIPMEDINMHFTGDMHAITTANNLISACLDNHIHQGNELEIDINNVIFKRCLDMNDRSLRQITISQGPKSNGVERQDGFVITVASEVMAILCLSSDFEDLKLRLGKILVAYSKDGEPIYVNDLNITGALALVLKDAIKPNLVQTLENNPVLIHGGPFANIAHGCNSIIATKLASRLSDYVVTEAGFGADLGAEKFLNIKCQEAGLKPDAVVIVATIRALKMHGGVNFDDLKEENVEALLKGVANLEKHIDTIKAFGLDYVIAINEFISDTANENTTLTKWARENSHKIVTSSCWANGSIGAIDLANEVVKICENDNFYAPIYNVDMELTEKISAICTIVYGAKNVEYSQKALKQIEEFKFRGYDKLRVCMAKTPISLSDNEKLVGRPEDFTIHIQEMKPSLGAGFIVCLTGKVMTMPGLPKTPAANKMDIYEDGTIIGLF